ncbi:MAG: triosephosphate isomerase (TIM) [Candidatus Berkelbacteria bacterium Athens1014_28]|uniref:Triosephosphate isomerase n=1 Tax=Candidatus Berkelbacteria bacterium Athens1014_28 TaxID=2017145 RepID=A0A554LP67_9BACT|nr:MAG: triosephosphate isomerase (TIM) [Candidatus Berkelbacteria bacterium Athens1014_28]
MRRPIVIGNWKMFGNLSDAIILATSIRDGIENFSNLEVVLCPPAIFLAPVSEVIHRETENIALGAQNIHYLSEGEYTGEISAKMIKNIAEYVIIGHSERRKYFSETSEIVSRKVATAIDAEISPIICVGETEKSSSSADKVISELKKLLSDTKKSDYEKVVIAYEPIWAVGAKEPATPEYAAKVMSAIREVVGLKTSIVYGGAVDFANVYEFVRRPEIDGVLVGRASLRAKEFIKICRIVSEYKKII